MQKRKDTPRHVSVTIICMQFLQEARTDRVGTALLVVVVYEVGLMGSGRLLQAGPLTVRMWLFLIALAYAACVAFFSRRVSMTAILLCAWLATMLGFAAAIGFVFNADMALVVEDVKPLIYFFLILFFETVIRGEREVKLVIKALKTAGLILCAVYAVVFGLLLSGVVSFGALYAAAAVFQDEVFFRGDSGMFMYKGSIYIGVALLFFLFTKGWRARVAVVCCALGVLATGTRGFVLALVGTVFLMLLMAGGKRRARKIAMGIGVAILGVAAWMVIARPEAQSGSDLERIITFHQVVARIQPAGLIFGHGFGKGVPERPVHMEGAFLEIFHKQGMLGLLWWVVVFGVLFVRFRNALRSGPEEIVQPLFFSVIFVFLVSMSNPWITNPIGMAVLLIALASLRVLAVTVPATESAGLSLRGAYKHASLDRPAPAN